MRIAISPTTAVCSLALLLSATTPGRADVMVLDSSVTGIRRGAELKDDVTLKVPAGASLTLMLPAGKTQTVKGPYQGLIRDLARGETVDKTLWRKIADIIKGGGSEASIGATRGIATRTRPETYPFAWNAVPFAANDNICIKNDRPLEFVRANTDRAVRAILVDPGGERHEVAFAAGVANVAWPSKSSAAGDADYMLLVPDQPMRQFTLRYVKDSETDPAQAIQTLYAKGCVFQLESWVRALASK
jgi:hypothetical protein